MLDVVIIGIGNVGTHLARALQKSEEVNIIQYFNRSPIEQEELSNRIGYAETEKFTSNWKALKEADVYIVAVKDDVIPSTIEAIPYKHKIVAHTSGSVALNSIENQYNAVFYPLQTFSIQRQVNMKEVPICLEASSTEVYQKLEKIAQSISAKVFNINSLQRRQLHLSAVFVCNFVNHLYHIGNELCENHKVDPSILEALIQETAHKIKELTPKQAQTGPALRGDIQTLQKHEKMLEEQPQFQKLYNILSASIANINQTNNG